MGLLHDDASDGTYTLHARTLIGRNPLCHVQVDDRRVSAEHATISWRGDGWELRDLGSSNGTWVDGQPIDAGVPVRLTTASRLSFGQPGDAWRLLEVDGPVPSARELMGDRRRDAVNGLIVLPDAEAPEVSIYCDAHGHWLAESPREVLRLEDQSIVPAGETVWRVHLPMPLAPTLREDARSSFALHFRVSADEEYVELDVVQGGTRHTIGARSFNYLLLVLARERMDDQERPESEQGWLHQEDLSRKLRISDVTVYTQIHRARQRLAEAGVDRAAQVVERRQRTRQLRIGTADLHEVTI